MLKKKYATGEINAKEITKKANRAMINKYKKKFETKPTTRINQRGYLSIYIPIVGYKLYHRYIWEKAYGPIPKGCVIHHIDGNKLNNILNNLQCMEERTHLIKHATKIDYKEVALLYKKGWTNQAIGRKLNISAASVSLWKKRNGFFGRNKNSWKENN